MPTLKPRADWDPTFAHAHPAFAPLRPIASRFSHFSAWPPIDAWNGALDDLAITSASGAPLRFIAQPQGRRRRQPIEPSTLYDVRIHDLGEVPSRDSSWHDFLNMLCWATFPRAKAALNARQCRAVRAWIPPGATQLPGARTREQDALAILDEGGAIVLCLAAECPSMERAIACGEIAPVTDHVRAGHARVLAFGHASYEHLVSAHPTVRAMPVTVAVNAMPATLNARVTLADHALAAMLTDPVFLAIPREDPAIETVDALFTD